jgi:AmmeMemoRadiSam system protein A
MPPHSKLQLCCEDRRALLAWARRAIAETISSQALPDLPAPEGRLAWPGGAFVTLRSKGMLRGCIGRIEADHALAETVAQCAITAALQDPRFEPLRMDELDGLQIEISVVSELSPVRFEEIQPGAHGIVVTRGASRALLLPQVAIERDWSTTEFLRAACRKANLPSDAWRDPETSLFAFFAEVFSETETRLTAEDQTVGTPVHPLA